MTQWVVKAMDLHPVNLGSIPAVTCMSHWWHQEEHLAKIVPVHQKSPTLQVGTSKPLKEGTKRTLKNSFFRLENYNSVVLSKR